MTAATWSGNRLDHNLLPPMTPAPFIRRTDEHTHDRTHSHEANQLTTMKQNHYEHVAEALESICNHLDLDVSGFGIWVAASSIVAAAHLAAAFVPLSTL